MFIVFLKFSHNKSEARAYMSEHNEWIKRGIEDRVFLLVGSLQPQLGGVLIAHDITHDALHARVQDDPFVQYGVVEPEIFEVSPSKADSRLGFLL